jgi:hypothetical protein
MTTRQRGLMITAVIAGVALAVALLASLVFPSSRSGDSSPDSVQVDSAGPVGRIGAIVVPGPNNGGATGALVELPGAGPGDYTERPGTGSITGPVGGVEAVLGAPATPATAGAGAARAVPSPTPGRGR